MFTFSGPMKSLSSAENESDERLFRYADPNFPQPDVPLGKSVRYEIDASPNVNASCAPSAPPSAWGIAVVFTVPTAQFVGVAVVHAPDPPPLMTVGDPHAEPDQVRIEIVGTVPPFERSYVTSLSPAVRTGVSEGKFFPLSAQFVGFAARSQNF